MDQLYGNRQMIENEKNSNKNQIILIEDKIVNERTETNLKFSEV